MPTDLADPAPPSDLLLEQRHLAESRAALKRMHDHTASLAFTGENTAYGGDHVSTQYLLQTLYRRMLSLRDDPTIPLFFGRLDYATALGADRDETHYVGRRHVTAETGGEPLVVDWRAPVSLPFYRARPADPMAVRRRRRFGFVRGQLTAYEDEDLTGGIELAHSDILDSEIERPRTGPMRDIVATIQPEQDVIVRTDLTTSVCVQGAPGTGKTAVGLHRAAYLLYAHREQLTRAGVLVVGPNDSFLSYIGDVLPALGEIDAVSETVTSLVGRGTGIEVTGEEDAAVSVLKGDSRLAEVLRRAVWDQLGTPTESLVVPRGSRQWRVPEYLISEVLAELRNRGIRYEAGREMLPQRLAHQVLLRLEAAGDSPDDRVQNAVARSAPVKKLCKQLWPAIDPAKLVWQLLSDADALARYADGILDEAEQALLRWPKPPRSVKSAKWTLADLVLIDEVGDLLTRTPSRGHLILDEAQDLSPMQLRAVGRRASTGSVTVLGDLAQATTPWATRSWTDALGHLGQPDARVEELVAGFRVPASVIEYAARLLPTIAPDLTPPHAVRRSRGDLAITTGSTTAVGQAVSRLADREGTIGVIVADADVPTAADSLTEAGLEFRLLGVATDEFDTRIDLVPASLAKGLEFDHVLLVEPAAIVDGEPDRMTGLRRLYVCLTRAVTSLVIVHDHDLPAELSD
ncbi:HelD family protein [Microlunatus sp. Y2014]|uniref:HelD family protein n=1 Tax=Microlunatus sp. Y2014 TaxID=3418488 RepID=UPI003DA6DD24